MKNLVIYESYTGFTARYAEWIARALGCECRSLKELKKREQLGDARIIFGGWVMGNGIAGLQKLQSMGVKPAAIYAVGSTPACEEVIRAIREQNQLGGTPFFYMEGGFRWEKLGFMQKMLLSVLKKSVAKKKERSAQDEFMAQALGTSFDHSGEEQITPLVEYLQGMA